MKEIRYTLLSDGSSDRALLPVLTWLLRQHLDDWAIQPRWADLRRLPRPPKKLASRMRLALDLYPCDLLFIHRDAEKEPHQKRVAEILDAASGVDAMVIAVVPVRMQEAWLLFDQGAIRAAAGNPHGKAILNLPKIGTLESLPDPKETLYDLLREASELHGRRRKKFSAPTAAIRIADSMNDFATLRRLPAFQALEQELISCLRRFTSEVDR